MSGTNKHPRKEAVRNPEPPLTRSREQHMNTFETVYTKHVYHKINLVRSFQSNVVRYFLSFYIVWFSIYIYTYVNFVVLPRCRSEVAEAANMAENLWEALPFMISMPNRRT